MHHHLAILMTAYNSGAYIEAQIDSILSQTYKDWDLFVRDDQSTDNTQTILSEYAEREQRIHVLTDGEKRGAKHGFMWMLQQIDADYYMFCDHDDVWLPAKVERSMAVMLQQQDVKETPLMVCTNAKVVDADLNVMAESYWQYKSHHPSMFADKYYHLFYNNVLGCTMLFNRKARDLSFPYPPNTAMHDFWLALTVLWQGGRIVPVEESLMLYRQHGSNTIGTPPVPSLWKQLMGGKSLLRKTREQYDANKETAQISYARFFLLKLKYMLRIHWASISKKLKR